MNQYLLFSSLIGLIVIYQLNDLAIIQIDEYWIFTSLFLTLFSMVTMIVEIRNHLISDENIKNFPHLRAAEQLLIDTIVKASKRNSEPLELKVIGNGLNRINEILTEIIDMKSGEKLGSREIKIIVYHIDPAFANGFFFSSSKNKTKLSKKNDGYSSTLLSHIDNLKDRVADIDSINISFVSYGETPYFYGFLIDSIDLFWGNFSRNERTGEWLGPSNPCFYAQRDNELSPGYTIDWIENRLSVFDDMQTIKH
ncbi:MAG: hypothetical protein ABJJ14_00400 [Cyclobacteriaceae bacterium]